MKNQAFSLVEVIIASAVLGLLAVSVVGVFVSTSKLQQRVTTKTFLTNEASNSIEVIRSIRNQDFSELEDGVYGLEKNNGIWELSNQVATVYGSRQVTINSLDDDSRQILSETVSGDNNVILETVLTNWQQEILLDGLQINTQAVTVTGSGNRIMTGVTLINDSSQEVVVTKITLSWNHQGASRKLLTAALDGADVWSSASGVSSGTSIPVTVTIGSTNQAIIDFTFSNSIKNRVLTNEVETADGQVITNQFET